VYQNPDPIHTNLTREAICGSSTIRNRICGKCIICPKRIFAGHRRRRTIGSDRSPGPATQGRRHIHARRCGGVWQRVLLADWQTGGAPHAHPTGRNYIDLEKEDREAFKKINDDEPFARLFKGYMFNRIYTQIASGDKSTGGTDSVEDPLQTPP